MNFLSLVFSFLFTLSLYSSEEIEMETIYQEPIFLESFQWTPMGSKDICKEIKPLLENHLKKANYDRMGLTVQYIRHHNSQSKKDPLIDPLKTLASFIPDLSVEKSHGGSCFGLTLDLLSKTPSNIFSYPIAASLFQSSQQEYWPLISHVALIIPFSNPKDPNDKGYILLDPHLKIEVPLVISLSGRPEFKYLKKKGVYSFFYENEKIISQNVLQEDLSMAYYLAEFANLEGLVKPILAADRKITLYSRTEKGEVLAYIKLLLDIDTIEYCLQGHPIVKVPFETFMTNSNSIECALADALHLEKEELSKQIKEILTHKNLLDSLYEKYTRFIENSSQVQDFYIPHLKCDNC